MKYYLKENFRFLYDEGQIYDENGDVAYTFEKETLFLPKISLYDSMGAPVGRIETELSFFLREYSIYLYDDYAGKIKQEFRFLSHGLNLDDLGWHIEGDFLAWNYQILDENGDIVADMEQELFHLTKHFNIEVYDEKDRDLVMLVVMAINQYDKSIDNANASASAHSSSR